MNSIYHTIQRYRTLKTDRIHALPIVILMPHSGCNCRCVMCDIWKDNKNLKQLTEADINGLLNTLEQFGTRQVLMSGGEALLNPNFFRFCDILSERNMSVTLLSTGMTLAQHAERIVRHVREVIISLDGDEQLHNQIRNIPSAYAKLKAGIDAIRTLQPAYKISGRSVIHRLNFRSWDKIISSAQALGLNSISFLPADVSSHAFNREVLWSEQRQSDILPSPSELAELKSILEDVVTKYHSAIQTGFIAESADKLRKIYSYYAASHGLEPYPFKRCNAPWVSTVIEADGTVRPCFFHEGIGNIRDQPLKQILNGEQGMSFRRKLDMDKDETCVRCVCYLNLPASAKI